jgi:hypothetical protein
MSLVDLEGILGDPRPRTGVDELLARYPDVADDDRDKYDPGTGILLTDLERVAEQRKLGKQIAASVSPEAIGQREKEARLAQRPVRIITGMLLAQQGEYDLAAYAFASTRY